jgi:hypothetical protein
VAFRTFSGVAPQVSAVKFDQIEGPHEHVCVVVPVPDTIEGRDPIVMFRRPPAEADMQRHFRVSPPSVHQMVLTIERAGFIRRQPGVARSIELLVAPENLSSPSER